MDGGWETVDLREDTELQRRNWLVAGWEVY